jgi:hypothetical protein
VNALIGPDGTTVEVKGQGGGGADILFRDSPGEVVLGREVKCMLGQSQTSFNDYVLYAGLEQVKIVSEGGAKEILLQLPAGTTEEDVETRLARMRGGNDVKTLTAEQVTKLKDVQITIVDPSGKVLASEAVLP